MIKVYGASDDLIEVEGTIDNEYPAPESATYFEGANGNGIFWQCEFIAPNGEQARVVVVMVNGCWMVAAGQVDESVPLPDWNFRFEQARDYSTALVFDPPEGTRITNTTTEE